MATETGDGSAGDTEASEPTDDALTGGSGTGESDEITEQVDQFTRSVTVTTVATLLGIVAGVASMLFATTTTGNASPEPDNLIGVAIVAATVFVQFPLYSSIGIDTDEFGLKTQLYVFAMTFFMWFITWTVLLTTNGLV
ncbi:MAG: hypothetical protein ACI9K3_000801 [Halovenus sp.]|jgi:hypothetical protein